MVNPAAPFAAAAQIAPGAMADSGNGSVKRKRHGTHIVIAAAAPPTASKVATKAKTLTKKASYIVSWCQPPISRLQRCASRMYCRCILIASFFARLGENTRVHGY
jgi:hypothetical protein